VTDLLLLDYNGVIVNDEPLHFAALRDVLDPQLRGARS
jgi:beta-phosphoglucomutase-like phosphatase (HAD superfamily)